MKKIDYILKRYDETPRGQIVIRTGGPTNSPSDPFRTFSITWADHTLLIFTAERGSYSGAIHLTLYPTRDRKFEATFGQTDVRTRWYEAYRTARRLARQAA